MIQLDGTIIRAVEIDDLVFTRRWRNDPSVHQSALGRRFPITETNEREWFENLGKGSFPTQLAWAVCDHLSSIVGLVQLSNINWIHRTVDFGIWISPDQQAKGHASRATRLVCDHASTSLNLRQIRLEVLATHASARAVYAKCGFVVEGQRCNAVFLDGRYCDMTLMVLDASSGGTQGGGM